MPEQTQTPQTNPAPASTPAQTPASAPKKSNAGLIIAIVLIVILLVLGGGGYLTYRYIKGRVSNVVSNVENNTSSSSSSTTNSSGSYDSAKDLTPTGALIIATNNDVKPILEKIYGGAKLQSWTMITEDYGYAGYIVKRDSNDTDATAIGTALIAKGYAQQSNTQNETGSIMIFTKGNGSLTIEVGTDNVINITITQDTSQ
jgi:hypothetical protein